MSCLLKFHVNNLLKTTKTKNFFNKNVENFLYWENCRVLNRTKCYATNTNKSTNLINFNGKAQKCFYGTETNKPELSSYLKHKIKMKGPITISEYMKEALGNPVWGYYMKKDVFGQKGDFITAPEISQMFGELVGVWFLSEWLLLKSFYGNDLPRCVQLVELGPGRGTLMNDLLKVWRKNKDASAELFIYLVETSPHLRKIQAKNLCNLDDEPKYFEAYKSKYSDTINITWLTDLTELPEKEAAQYFLANEFFDALSIQKFQKTPQGYREILIDYNEKLDKFEYRLSPNSTMGSKLLLNLHPTYNKFDHVEISVESARYVEAISKRISDYNGSMLIIDYGHDGVCKDTFRAFKSHKLVDVFETPGECDLTADVDFSFLKHIAKRLNLICYGPTSQEEFLKKMHVDARFQVLLKHCKNEEEKSKLITGLDMLMNSEKMGQRFKLMSIRKFDFKEPPPGF